MFSYTRVRSALARSIATLALLLATGLGTAATAGATTEPPCTPAVAFERDDFSHPTTIDNKWLPLVPGEQFTLEGSANTGGGSTAHTVVLTVTGLTKVLNGVTNRVLWDQDFQDGQLTESELTFFAQDDHGNVWNLGEYPEEYENGVFTGAPSTWIGGLQGATAGLQMLANPHVGSPSYLQGSSPAIAFLDCAQVFATGQSVSVPFGSFRNVLVNNEWSPLSPDSGIQRKFYAPGVGNVEVTAVGDPEGETLQLTSLAHLGPKAMAQVHREALRLDRHGHEVSFVYSLTPPAR
jgi:hypothetical protein